MLDTHCLIYIVDLLVTIHISRSWVGWEHVSTDDDDELRAIIIFIHSSIIWEWIEIDMLLQNEPLALPFYFLLSLISLGSKTASLVIIMTNHLWDPHILCFIGSFLRIPQGQQDDLVRKPQLFNCRFLYCIFCICRGTHSSQYSGKELPLIRQIITTRCSLLGSSLVACTSSTRSTRKMWGSNIWAGFLGTRLIFFANRILYPLDDIPWIMCQRNLMFDRWPTPMWLNPWGCKGQGLRPAFKVTILQAPSLKSARTMVSLSLVGGAQLPCSHAQSSAWPRRSSSTWPSWPDDWPTKRSHPTWGWG